MRKYFHCQEKKKRMTIIYCLRISYFDSEIIRFSTDSRHTCRYKLCSSSRRLVPLFVWGRLHTWASREKRKEASPILYFTFRYIDDVLSLNNSRFGEFVDRIYPIELEIKDTTDTDRYASYLDVHLEIDSEGWLRTKLYDKRDDFNFPIVNFPFNM